MIRPLVQTRGLVGLFLAASLLVVEGWMGASSAQGQETPAPQAGPATPDPETADKETESEEEREIRRLPTFYREVVAPYQRQKIYDIQAKYEGQVKALQEQIKALLAQRDTEIEGVLLPEQREMLKRLKAEAAQRAREVATRKKTEAAPASANAATPPAAPNTTPRNATATPAPKKTGAN